MTFMQELNQISVTRWPVVKV